MGVECVYTGSDRVESMTNIETSFSMQLRDATVNLQINNSNRRVG